AGGVVLNVDPDNFRGNHERALLSSRAVAPHDVALSVWTEISCRGIIEPSRFLERSHFSAAEIAAALKRLSDHGEILLSENLCAKMVLWRELRARVADMVDVARKNKPERRGLEVNEIRAQLTSVSHAAFDPLI